MLQEMELRYCEGVVLAGVEWDGWSIVEGSAWGARLRVVALCGQGMVRCGSDGWGS